MRRTDSSYLARQSEAWFVFLFGLCVLSSPPAYSQNKAACDLIPKADAESILGVTIQPPKPSAPFRSLLDPDFTSGTPEQGCEITNYVPDRPKPPKVVNVRVEVRYSATPNAHVVEDARKQVDTRTYDHPTDLPGLGDTAFWIGAPNNITLFVFVGGTARLMIGPSEIGLEQEKALAVKALASLGNKTTFTYGTPSRLNKPVLANASPNSSALDKLKRALTAKADRGDTKAQVALGKLYESGRLGTDGNAQPDYAGAAYWYEQAMDHGNPQAAYKLAILYRDGLGIPADGQRSFELLQKAAEANYVPAMPMLSDAYAGQKTSVSAQRATEWATRAAEAGDPNGWLRLGFEYSSGKLGGDRPYWYKSAMDAFRKAAAGGNCVAMMAIGELYASGNGVAADRTQVQSWQAKAESCQGSNLALLQQQISQYRARAAAAREPVFSSMIDAIPAVPSGGAPVARNGHNADSRMLARIAAAVAMVAAISALIPDTGANADGVSDDATGGRNDRLLDNLTCGSRGGTVDVLGSCSR